LAFFVWERERRRATPTAKWNRLFSAEHRILSCPLFSFYFIIRTEAYVKGFDDQNKFEFGFDSGVVISASAEALTCVKTDYKGRTK